MGMTSAGLYTPSTAEGSSGGLTSMNLGMSHRFVVKVGTYNLGNWSKCQGLKVDWDPIQHRPGDVVNGLWNYPGIAKYEKIKLARAVDNQTAQLTWTWLKTISTMNMPSDGLVQMFTSKMLGAGTPLMSWVLQGAFPVSWEIDAFDAGASKVAMENLTIIHEGFLMDETKLSAGSL
jgi:phage tail-like protein